ncbi:Proteolipid membrane potential modulator protein [Dioscorea alata]|uniref:Proteolipid membrane potential modulator protein n=3 Tax=Dioscorea alata TaxID=55571 RepID=A0ACB7WJV9_DIOAL|nr:Proteolipid membrane potential modulator protein [Dioscorea alata]KAH7688292.1 Proteolipid membrane potential modulator protein [Dioscorea alata]KAH7688293.1 Proteolipid membrane potential modulator protein [Dioscorea alata]
MADLCCKCLEILIAILLPPLGVCLRHGCCSLEFCICLALTILGYLPGILYALYVIVAVEPDRHRHDYYHSVNEVA